MKRILMALSLICLIVTGCSDSENKEATISQSTAAETEADSTSGSFAETLPIITTSEPVTTMPPIEMEGISEDYDSGSNTKTIGDEEHGYMEVSEDWERTEYGSYIDGSGNEISFFFFDDYSDKDISEIVKSSYGVWKRHFSDVGMIECELNGFKAYRTDYCMLNAIEGPVVDDKYVVDWYFERADGINMCIKFKGENEEIIEMSDDIMKTYRLYN